MNKKLISIQLDLELLEKLKAYCKETGATLSGSVRLAIIKFLEGAK